jgi:HEPN domain-containing protein
VEPLRREAQDWFDAALVDLEEARAALAGGRYNWAVFAAHQAAEKALKAAYMVLHRSLPPRTHDLVRLVREAGLRLPSHLVEGLSELSPYYVVSRYPNAGLERPWESISRATAERLLRIAEEVVELVGRETGLRRARPTGEG